MAWQTGLEHPGELETDWSLFKVPFQLRLYTSSLEAQGFCRNKSSAKNGGLCHPHTRTATAEVNPFLTILMAEEIPMGQVDTCTASPCLFLESNKRAVAETGAS